MNPIDWIILVGILALLALTLLVILPWRLRRAMRLVIQAFIDNNATTAKKAIPVEKLKIKPPPSMFSLRLKIKDFKNEALNVLLSTGAVQKTEDDKLFLVEERIDFTKLGRGKSYYSYHNRQ